MTCNSTRVYHKQKKFRRGGVAFHCDATPPVDVLPSTPHHTYATLLKSSIYVKYMHNNLSIEALLISAQRKTKKTDILHTDIIIVTFTPRMHLEIPKAWRMDRRHTPGFKLTPLFSAIC